jgi:integrase/recombinase XerD
LGNKYEIPTGKNIKKVLDLSDIGKIYHYNPNPAIPVEERAKDFWLLSYLGDGMNTKSTI